jgi:hypothetical protein
MRAGSGSRSAQEGAVRVLEAGWAGISGGLGIGIGPGHELVFVVFLCEFGEFFTLSSPESGEGL